MATSDSDTTAAPSEASLKFRWWYIPLILFIVCPLEKLYLDFWFKSVFLFLFGFWDKYGW